MTEKIWRDCAPGMQDSLSSSAKSMPTVLIVVEYDIENGTGQEI